MPRWTKLCCASVCTSLSLIYSPVLRLSLFYLQMGRGRGAGIMDGRPDAFAGFCDSVCTGDAVRVRVYSDL